MRFIQDSGHGWLAVSLHDYPRAWNYGTGFGYIDDENSVIYLEEDCEAYGFLKLEGLLDTAKDLPSQVIDGNCWVRRLPHNEAVFDTSKLYAGASND